MIDTQKTKRLYYKLLGAAPLELKATDFMNDLPIDILGGVLHNIHIDKKKDADESGYDTITIEFNVLLPNQTATDICEFVTLNRFGKITTDQNMDFDTLNQYISFIDSYTADSIVFKDFKKSNIHDESPESFTGQLNQYYIDKDIAGAVTSLYTTIQERLSDFFSLKNEREYIPSDYIHYDYKMQTSLFMEFKENYIIFKQESVCTPAPMIEKIPFLIVHKSGAFMIPQELFDNSSHDVKRLYAKQIVTQKTTSKKISNVECETLYKFCGYSIKTFINKFIDNLKQNIDYNNNADCECEHHEIYLLELHKQNIATAKSIIDSFLSDIDPKSPSHELSFADYAIEKNKPLIELSKRCKELSMELESILMNDLPLIERLSIPHDKE